MNQSFQGFFFLVIMSLVCLNQSGCNESFLNQPPFEQVQDTVFLDANNWFYFSPDAIVNEDIPMFPFTYQIFEASGDGFLLKGDERIYFLASGNNIQDAHVFFDNQAQIGDTLNKFSDRHYHLLIDKKYDDKLKEDIYYTLRRSKKGVGSLEERSIWVLSIKRGLLAVNNYDINSKTGAVEFDIVGASDHFRDSDFIRKIKYYDFDRAYQVDRERNIIYTFEKHLGRLKSKNFERREELFEYRFKTGSMSELINFRIEASQNTIMLIAEDSCYLFNEMLELQSSSLCE